MHCHTGYVTAGYFPTYITYKRGGRYSSDESCNGIGGGVKGNLSIDLAHAMLPRLQYQYNIRLQAQTLPVTDLHLSKVLCRANCAYRSTAAPTTCC